MCGIIGVVSNKSSINKVVKALRILEYRGYDSVGIASIDEDEFQVRKTTHKIDDLCEKIKKDPINGSIMLGHTRWATHGKPSIRNTHPICTKNTAVVHNGVIENYLELKKDLSRSGNRYNFHTDTDSEVIPNIIDYFQDNKNSLIESVLLCAPKLKGSFAIGLISKDNPDMMIAMKQGSPSLIIGLDKDGDSCYITSDVLAISEFCDEVTYLDDGQIAIIESNQFKITDFKGNNVPIKTEKTQESKLEITSHFNNFMIKEIHEQPKIIEKILQDLNIKKVCGLITQSRIIKIIACGSSMYTGLIAKSWLEERYDIEVIVEIASEFYSKKNKYIKNDDIFLFISQSGETADTLDSLKLVKSFGAKSIAIVNAANSSIARLADEVVFLNAGPEIAVAATKSVLAQVTAFALIADFDRKIIKKASDIVTASLKNEEELHCLAKNVLIDVEKVIFIGRGIAYPIAMEAALKMKELTYIPSEGIAGGELKHGSIALIDDKTPVIVLAPVDHNFKKIISNANEVKSRGAKVILVTTKNAAKDLRELYDYLIEIPEHGDKELIPFAYMPIMQLIAYSTALVLGRDIDKPRNLAKSVTIS